VQLQYKQNKNKLQLDNIQHSGFILLSLTKKPWDSVFCSARLKLCPQKLAGFDNTATFFVVLQQPSPHIMTLQQLLVTC